ncbi:carboxypeptidase-like regulatory domain-containing protein [Chondromyces apiculatus]|uniref:PEGA domain-containing protein n=1 Tax=Chondromyces apiculatus DSM 436 TaxID=1192034 RepID=A0A017THW7_9BACT|nr:carboxypeptidase-like regulatory domain-containing protein [Chondromyces apiculatus]EYF08477.1 Hypothetical protein CAP_4006 [Chondromyces apiculatus DSM 436]
MAALGVGAALVTGPAVSAAEEGDDNDACVSSYERSQQLRRSSDMVRAKGELRLCLGACPRALARDCEKWLKETEKQIARVSVRVVDAEGATFAGATLSVDGVPARADEKGEIEVNPGKRVIRAEASDAPAVEEAVEVKAAGQVAVTLTLLREARAPEVVAPPPVVVERSTPVLGLTLGGVGLVGLGVGGALALFGHLERSSLEDECAPLCSDKDVAGVERLWLAGGITAGAGALLLGVGVGLVLAHGGEQKTTAIQPVVHVLPGSAGLGLLGHF